MSEPKPYPCSCGKAFWTFRGALRHAEHAGHPRPERHFRPANDPPPVRHGPIGWRSFYEVSVGVDETGRPWVAYPPELLGRLAPEQPEG